MSSMAKLIIGSASILVLIYALKVLYQFIHSIPLDTEFTGPLLKLLVFIIVMLILIVAVDMATGCTQD